MPKTSHTSLIDDLRTSRGLSLNAVAVTAGISTSTYYRASSGDSTMRPSTWREILTAIAASQPFDTDELARIVAETPLSAATVDEINAAAHHVPTRIDGRSTPVSRFRAALERAEAAGRVPELMKIIEAFAASLPAVPREPAQRAEPTDPVIARADRILREEFARRKRDRDHQ